MKVPVAVALEIGRKRLRLFFEFVRKRVEVGDHEFIGAARRRPVFGQIEDLSRNAAFRQQKFVGRIVDGGNDIERREIGNGVGREGAVLVGNPRYGGIVYAPDTET